MEMRPPCQRIFVSVNSVCPAFFKENDSSRGSSECFEPWGCGGTGGIFTSVKDLARKLRRYINAYSANANQIQWKHSDPTRRIRSNVVPATCR
jgi:hypothetical protein